MTDTSSPDQQPKALRGAAKIALRGVFGYFVAHRTAANLLMLIMALAGAYSLTKIRTQFFPDFVIEAVTVRVDWPGAGAADVDDGIVSRLESALTAVEGVDRVFSSAREGRASVVAEFQNGWDMARAAADVESAIGAVRDLPPDTEDPEFVRRGFRDRVTNVAVSGPVGIDVLSRYADELTARLFQAGVTKVSSQGLAAPEIKISAPEYLRRLHDVTFQEIIQAVSADVAPVAAGGLTAGAARVRAGERRVTAADIGAVAVRSEPDGRKIYVRDVARVTEETLGGGAAFYRGGAPAVVMTVERDASGDAIALQRAVEKAVADLAPTLPAGVSVELYNTRAQAIIDRIDILVRNGVGGLVIVLILLFLFLSARTALWVALGIPVSLLAAIGVMYVFGVTLNMISLFALILTLGIIVDDAIVVGEHADFLARHRGLPPREAAALAARRMTAPVLAASVTTVIAFAALMVLGGRLGSLIAVMPLTVSAVVIASLIECFLILPNHMSHALRAKTRQRWWDAPSRAVNTGFDWIRDRVFRPLTTLALKLRYVVLAATIASLLASMAMMRDGSVRYQRFSFPERSVVTVNIAMAPGAVRADTQAMLEEMRRALEAVAARYDEQQDRPSVKFAVYKVGGNLGRGLSAAEDKDPDQLGALQAELLDPDFRPWEQRDFIRAWRAEIQRGPMLEILAFRGGRFGGGGDAISVEMSGGAAETLKAAAEALKQALGAFPAVTGLDDSMPYDKTELSLTLTPRGLALGFDAAKVGAELRRRLSGATAAEIARDGQSIKITAAPPDGEVGADYLDTVWLRAPDGSYAALSDIVDVTARQGFASVKRENGRRLISVTGDIADDPAAEAEIRAAMAATILPGVAQRYGVEVVETGAAADERRFLTEALIGFSLCLAGIYLALAWVFASWTRPLAVMLIIPFGFVGALWGHYWMGVTMSMFSIVGLIGLSGIIVNDSIVLITTVDEYARSRPFRRAIIDAACDRLRPVLLTTLTTVAGMTPLLLESSRQAAFLKPTVITLVFGMSFGLLLVMFAVPALLAMQRDFAQSLRSFRRMVVYLWRRRAQRRKPKTYAYVPPSAPERKTPESPRPPADARLASEPVPAYIS